MTPRLLWQPSAEFTRSTNLFHLMAWLEEHGILKTQDYQELWNWSVSQNSGPFWSAMWQYFNIQHDGKFTVAVSGEKMPDFGWFPGTSLNYAEHVFRQFSLERPAIIYHGENEEREISWTQLKDEVTSLQYYLLQCGVEAGDCIAAFLPALPEATFSLLATTSVGAIWSSCSPDFGTQAVVDRFAQINPKVLIVSQSYHYGGKRFDKAKVIQEIVDALPGVKRVIVIGGDLEGQTSRSRRYIRWEDATAAKHWTLTFTRVPFSHPMWVLYSSGTTGLPKAITHSQGGILMEHFKYLSFHHNIKAGDRCCWYTTTGWMMWNYINSSLLLGATLVLFDGSPSWPDLNVLWKFISEKKVKHVGTSAGFILSCMKEGIAPAKSFDLSRLESLSSTGSTLPPEGFDWVYREVGKELWLVSMSGGTDVCSAFVGGNPVWSVYAGEIQCRALGCSLEAFDELGHSVRGEVGEMVITGPMPSMPVYFWNDEGGIRYRESYFEKYPGVWRHGDWILITDRQGIVIFGRSDATLNRGGVRIGTSEIYRALDKIAEVQDGLIVCLEGDQGSFYMPLFIKLREGQELTQALVEKIKSQIRIDYSPRHVPDEIIAVPEIPYTISGKKTETPVKKVLMGKEVSETLNTGSLRNPESMDFFVQFYNNRLLR